MRPKDFFGTFLSFGGGSLTGLMTLMAETQNGSDRQHSSRGPNWLLVLGIGAVALFLLAAAAAGGIYYYAVSEFEKPGPVASGSSEETIYTLPRGQGLIQIAQDLENMGLISNAVIFRFGVMQNEASGSLKAGEYAIPSRASMFDIMEILREGKSILYKLTIPEGLTSAQIIRLVNADETLVGSVEAVPDEGTLLPETYLFQRGTTAEGIVEQMQSDARATIDELWENRTPDLPLKSKEEAIILASIVEKETGVAAERKRVAAVFINRLRRGMRMESDPTIIYGLTQGEPLGRGLRKSELAKETPYNTYIIDRLPPTPIANPGYASIEAVLNPADTKELFFVADGTGGHVFAKTYAQHRRNVAAWRRIERERKQR